MAAFLRLVINSGPTPGKDFPLEKPEIFIGRDLGNDIVINDPEVSRRHARLYLQGSTYIIEDLGSTNGTSINGQRLTGPYMLRAGEQVTFGERVILAVEAVQRPPETATVIPVPPPASVRPPAYQPQAYPAPAPASPQPYQPAAQPQQQPYTYQAAYPPQPSYPPPQPPEAQSQPPFSGQVPFSPSPEPPVVQYRIPVWVFVVLAFLLLTILVLLIDDFHLWCPLFGIC